MGLFPGWQRGLVGWRVVGRLEAAIPKLANSLEAATRRAGRQKVISFSPYGTRKSLGFRFPAPEGSGLLSYDPYGIKNSVQSWLSFAQGCHPYGGIIGRPHRIALTFAAATRPRPAPGPGPGAKRLGNHPVSKPRTSVSGFGKLCW